MGNRYWLRTTTGIHITAGPLALVAAQAAHLASTGTPVDVDDGTQTVRVETIGIFWLEPQELFPSERHSDPPSWLGRFTTLVAELLGTTTQQEKQPSCPPQPNNGSTSSPLRSSTLTHTIEQPSPMPTSSHPSKSTVSSNQSS